MTKSREVEGQIVPRAARELTPFEELDRLFNRMWEGGLLRPFQGRWPDWGQFQAMEGRFPKVDVIDREQDVLVRAELPGFSKEHLDVSVKDDFLTIKGEEHEEKTEEGDYYHAEIRHGGFMRTLRLPATVDGDKASASFSGGLLEITLPKTEQTKKHSVKIA